ncbi:hypothetical protein BJF85_16000 [Saccharomonospora sp. CUA-673]|uniref:alpha/beta hydrolase family protein n=1 Tax=Saccharomonospora sp. CUA-673 TaxID=1904969 RepID=UPI00096965AA|nr:dienelactone hydrolase family protein [Saccharomonospora sp. CUA-673]OLT46722.1 hypothetical protein BJF85_16000 [Saccharomonospora sp. CUA-673]
MRRSSLRNIRRSVTASLAVSALVLAAGCATDEGERVGGEQDVRAEPGAIDGPLDVATESVDRDDVGFGGGTVYYPDTDDGATYPVIAAAPGRGADEAMVSWYGDLLAANGFVVLTMNSDDSQNSPDERGHQLVEALDHLVDDSAVASRIDAERMGVLGHSMGGGGALVAAAERPDIKAAVALTPHEAAPRDWSELSAPTLIIGGDLDPVTPNEEHAEPMYEELTGAEQKAFMNLNGDHFVATPPSTAASEQVLAWFKRFVDDDADYADELCPAPETSDHVLEYRDTCPHD